MMYDYATTCKALRENLAGIGINFDDVVFALNGQQAISYSKDNIGVTRNTAFRDRGAWNTSTQNTQPLGIDEITFAGVDDFIVFVDFLIFPGRNTTLNAFMGRNDDDNYFGLCGNNLRVQLNSSTNYEKNYTFADNVRSSVVWKQYGSDHSTLPNDFEYFVNGESTGVVGGIDTNTTRFKIDSIGNGYSGNTYRHNGLIYQVLIVKGDIGADQIKILSNIDIWRPKSITPFIDFQPTLSTINCNDTCTVSESISIHVGAAVADIGAGVDVFGGMGADIPVIDSGSGADDVSPVVSISVFDTASAIDVVSQVINSLSIPDAGSALDSVSQIIAALVVADASSASDGIGVSVLGEIVKVVSDTGLGSDAIQAPVVSISLSDSALGADLVAAISAALSIQDYVSAADIVNVIKTKLIQVSDVGSGVDSVSMSVSLTVPDVSTAVDVVGQVLASFSVSDVGNGADTAIATNFDMLPSGKVTVTFSIKIPSAEFIIN